MSEMLSALHADDNPVRLIEAEPRILDTVVAEWLEYAQPRQIRQLIQRNIEELERYGICCTAQQIQEGAGRPGTEYWLNKAQALLICTQSQTPKAADVRELLIKCFLEFEQDLVIPRSHALVPFREIQIAIQKTVGPMLQPIETKVDLIAGKVERIEADTAVIKENLGRKRKDFSLEDQKLFRLIISTKRFSGMCPLCELVQVVGDASQSFDITKDGQYDHFNGRPHENDFANGWIICRNCNLKKEKKGKSGFTKHELQHAFDEFHRTAVKNSLVPPKPKSDTPSKDQPGLF